MPARAERSGSLLKVEPVGVLVPKGCACCGAEAAKSDVLRLKGGAGDIIVGYCDECRAHQGAERTRRLSGGLAAGLVGLGLGLGLVLPLSPRPLSAAVFAAIALGGALLPILAVAAWPRRTKPGHTAVGVAVRSTVDGELSCANDRWAAELARLNDASRRLSAWREARVSLPMFIGPALAPLAALLALNRAAPIVRVVNLSGERFYVELDGVRRATLDPTSVESPAAGVEFRIGVGAHELVARSPDGRVLERTSATIEAGRAHLFAPGSAGYCFWLETAGYGRSGEAPVTREPLAGPPHFWPLPSDLGGWFSPPPEARLAETRLTGGVVMVLRQAPCEALRPAEPGSPL